MKAVCKDFLDFLENVVKQVITTVSVEEISGEVRNWQVILVPQVDNCLLFSTYIGMLPT